ncbi:tetratricopeptide repeat protein [Acinetobacter rudis]|uniref:tetratricopeptide repeat protein n=1 Tax=Acinetobacter rudis TaxID=632955 RepID=UPI00280D63AF|nr:tetratricopeptide repeat protein [Acinetobacter rudis]MDQ8953557.1 tetratricopeptide repeat protein [Acinetobacter rudis]
MKKLLLATLIALSSQHLFAAPPANSNLEIDPTFKNVQTLVQAKDFKGAYQELERLSKAGNAQATYNLAYLTQIGQGTTQSNTKALQLYEEAGKKGYSIANYVLAQNYATGGLGLKQDDKKAREYLEKASNQGFNDATVELAVLLFSEGTAKSDQQALKKLEPLIKQGNYPALHAKALYDISLGFKNKDQKTIEQGLNQIQELGKKGYIPALMAIANMFTNGNVTQQNLPEAQQIYAALAEQNVPEAKARLELVNKMIAEQSKSSKK